MSLALLAPLGLLALAALVVPALIHLRRRTEEVPVDFAAMRWLEALPRPRSKLRFDELLLLALRLLLVALLALLLARPAVLGWQDESAVTLVAPGVDPEVAQQVADPETEPRWIAPGYPELGTSPPGDAQVSSLIRQFDAELPEDAQLTIIVPEVLGSVDAEPLRLTRPVVWRVVESVRSEEAPAPLANPALSVRYLEGSAAQVRYFEAAVSAWSEDGEFDASAGSDMPEQGRVLVWLKPGPVPLDLLEWVRAGGTAFLAESTEVAMPGTTTAMWRDELGDTLVEGGPVGRGRLLRFTRKLDAASMPQLLDGSFPARLRDLVASEAPEPARVASTAFEPVAGTAPYPLPPQELTRWLALLIALLFLAERLLATRRARFAA